MKIRESLQKLERTAVMLAPCVCDSDAAALGPAHWLAQEARPVLPPGDSGREYPRDYGVSRGSCDRDEIGAVLGGVAGGVIGLQVGKG